jgi:DNA processing protein
MLSPTAAVALSFLPGRARFALVALLRDRWPAALDPHRPAGPAPSLRDVVAALAVADSRASGALVPGLLDRATRSLLRARAAGIRPVVVGEPDYPARLAAIHDPPVVLWVRGDPAALRSPAVAIVGARAATPGALQTARDLAAGLAAAGVVVVSGLARGVDAAAHAGALETGRTVAVLGSGPDVIYPAEHRGLAAGVVGAGALVSEWAAGTAPRGHHFPLRNRIISGLSLGVVVVEAAEKSGSLITARCAADQGRDVMAVPGSVCAGRNRGAHALLRDGARLVEKAEDVLDEIGLRPPGRRGSSPPAGDPDPLDPVLAVMPRAEPVPLDGLAALTGLAPPALLARLTAFELDGRVVRAAGGCFVRP